MLPIEIRDVTLTYDTPGGKVPGVKDVSFNIDASEFLCIVGPSGCGKSTLAQHDRRFPQRRPPARSASAARRSPATAWTAAWCSRISPSCSRGAPRSAMSSFGLEMKGVPKAERENIAREQLRLVKLEKFTDSFPHHLSGGMQQRVAIARALAYNPAVLLMDEPFAALDALTRDDMQRLLAEVWRETRKTVIYVTHNVAEAVYLADRVVVMTPHPGTVKAVIKIPLPRPRDPLSVEFVECQKELLRYLGHDASRERDGKSGRPTASQDDKGRMSMTILHERHHPPPCAGGDRRRRAGGGTGRAAAPAPRWRRCGRATRPTCGACRPIT